ncbi:hypothetical protein FVR03_04240 [Pontibacter qinzhouensis]|uniref:DUF3575 domain-containing protein n=1 Tax=Pontibacter qinzhouensis TaxID=2603253 RepID=A0A5C8KBU0_9BACT|nr:hypothetical protein [Pontibacter qinzhouensis]TXK50869.1 hypothetical protein FVR03_04240 [Pontibacter qinzhouensis]
MKHIYLLILFTAFSWAAYAQSYEGVEPEGPEETPELNKLLKAELGLHGIGLSYELPVSAKFLVDISGGLGAGYAVTKGSYYTDSFSSTWIFIDPVVYVKAGGRYLYNRSKRFEKLKSVRNNAGNFIGFQTKYTTQRAFNNNVFDQMAEPLNRTWLNEIHWGIQRDMSEKILFNLHLGIGYAADLDFRNSIAYPAIGATFSYILHKKSI